MPSLHKEHNLSQHPLIAVLHYHDQPELDFSGKRNPDGQGFAAFGKVIKGMEVVREIQSKPDKDQMLVAQVNIIEVVRIKPDNN